MTAEQPLHSTRDTFLGDTTVYTGYGPGSPGGGHLVTVTRDGVESPLRHVVMHSPTGFAWSYGGSGPADLALSLLVDALGDRATCRTCGGTGEVVFDQDADREVPYDEERHTHPGSERFSEPMGCMDCDRGIPRGLPYQEFKWAVVAGLGESWTLTREQILDWYDQNAARPAR
jgi:hypothetical protein